MGDRIEAFERKKGVALMGVWEDAKRKTASVELAVDVY